ncbi:zinc finger and BTB domain-containing protein 22-like [Bacillus rossius redtenbacheri]|uniref:zinc finger and BTB domain-containing protein 22-like n=1 Tax=Bacillus rossius redtenbacheri TaxID=93214 RepID=UPI002FDDFBB3
MESEQQLNLRWNNYTNNMLEVFAEQLRTGQLVDCTLSSQGQFLKAHKMVLSACSPYFQELFKNHYGSNPVIIFNGISFLDLKLVIDFMYRGEIKVLEAELEGLLAAAETLQVKGLTSARGKYETGQVEGDSPPFVAAAAPSPMVLRKKRPSPIAINAKPENSMDTENLSVFEAPKKSSPSTSEAFGSNGILSSVIKTEPPECGDAAYANDNEDDEEGDIAGWETPKIVVDLKCDFSKATSVKSNNKISRTLRSRADARPYGTRAKLLRDRKARGSRSHEESDGEPEERKRKKRPGTQYWLDSDGLRIPRPPNAFMVFANEWRSKLAGKYPGETNKDISVRLGVMWKSLGADTKEGYFAAARRADQEHKRRYPGYYYSPKEARIRKFLRHDRRGADEPPAPAPAPAKREPGQLHAYVGAVLGRSGRWKSVGKGKGPSLEPGAAREHAPAPGK